MSEVNSEMAGWLLQHGLAGWSILLGVGAFGTVYGWLVKADPVSIISSMLNFKRRRLEGMLKQQFSDTKVYDLVMLELNQHSLYKLTGIIDHRLQNVSVRFLSRFNMRARYLEPWRNWLTEKDGEIKFDKKGYRQAWISFVFGNLPSSLVFLGFLLYLFEQSFGPEYLAPFMLFNIVVWLFPWLMISRVPTPGKTKEMAKKLIIFNHKMIRRI